MQSPVVSGALTYTELIMAAKNEEQRQSELRKRRNYQSGLRVRGPKESGGGKPSGTFNPSSKSEAADKRLCYKCGKPGHIAKNCRVSKSESKGGGVKKDSTKQPNTRQVQVDDGQDPEGEEASGHSVPKPESEDFSDNPLAYLFSSEDRDSVKLVHVKDQGSHSQMAKVSIQGFPTEGIIDRYG